MALYQIATYRYPIAKCKDNAIVFQRPPRVSRIGLKLVSLLDFRSPTEFLEKSVIRSMDTFQFLLDCLRRQRLPMGMCCLFQMFHVVTHALKVDIRQSVFVALTLPLMKIDMHLPHIVKQVSNAYRIRLFPKRIFIGFHGLSSIKSLTPNEWVGRHVALRLRSLCLPTPIL